MDEAEILSDWISNYLRHKDILTKRITSIEPKDGKLIVNEKDNIRVVLIRPELGAFYQDIDEKERMIVVTYNTQANVKALETAWQKIRDNPKLSIFFVNPLSHLEKRWIIMPKTHSLVADETALGVGLQSLYETVEPVTKEVLDKLKREYKG